MTTANPASSPEEAPAPAATPAAAAAGPPTPPSKFAVAPTAGEVIATPATGNSYTMGEKIGEGSFGVVFSCRDQWDNDLAAKVFKPLGTYEKVQAAAEAELGKLRELRHPFITFVYDAFEYRDTFYIITERCAWSLSQLFLMEGFVGPLWLMGIARCLLQAVHYLHINNYVHQDIHPGNVFTAFLKDELLKGPMVPTLSPSNSVTSASLASWTKSMRRTHEPNGCCHRKS